MNQQASTNPSDKNDLVGSLVGLGAEWAVFGLRCATSALEQSSRSMRLAAKSLATLSREIEASVPAEEENPIEPTVTADPSEL